MFNVDINFLTPFTTRTSKGIIWEYSASVSAQTIMLLWTRLKPPVLLEAQNDSTGPLFYSTVAFAAAESWGNNNPGDIGNATPFRMFLIHGQLQSGDQVTPGNALPTNRCSGHHVDTTTGLKHHWFDRRVGLRTVMEAKNQHPQCSREPALILVIRENWIVDSGYIFHGGYQTFKSSWLSHGWCYYALLLL
jgi:hypothetical protein